MPTTIISTAITAPVSAGATNNSNFIVTETGSIVVGPAVALGSNAASGFSATILGTVSSYWQDTSFIAAVYTSTPASRITIGSSGNVFAERESIASGSGVIWTAGAGSVVVNQGNIVSGTIEGVRLASTDSTLVNSGQISAYLGAVVATGAGTQIDNSGTLIATGIGGATVSLGGGGEIVNSGFIYGVGGALAVSAIGAVNLTNSGTISSSSTAISFDDPGGSRIVNSGIIQTTDTVAIVGGIDDDLVINRGTIIGNVQLGNGTNVFDNRGGTFAGTVEGGTGDDYYFFDVANFGIFDNGGSFDTILASQSYSLNNASAVEYLVLLNDAVWGEGNALDNTLDGNLVDNALTGGDGNDSLNGGTGNDGLRGGAGLDVLDGGDDDDRLSGGRDDDLMFGEGGRDLLEGGQGLDMLDGGEGDDELLGGANNDGLIGRGGDDLLFGGRGRDNLIGGADFDTFALTRLSDSGITVATRDVIADFVTGTDLIDLSRLDAKAGENDDAFVFFGTANFSGTAGQLRYRVSGPNLIVEGDVTGDGIADFALVVNGMAGLVAGDFVL